MWILGWVLWLLALASAQAAEVPVAMEDLVLRGELDQPSSAVADPAGQIYVLDGTHNRVRVYSGTGVWLSSFGSDLLKGPLDAVLADEGLLVADTCHERLVLFSPDGKLLKSLALPDADCKTDDKETKRARDGQDGFRSPASQNPLPLGEGRVRGKAAEISVAVPQPLDARALTPTPTPLPEGEGLDSSSGADRGLKAAPTEDKPPACTPGPSEPVAVAVQDGLAYWADRRGHRICRTRLADGQTLSCFGGRGATEGKFQYPYQLVFDRDSYLHAVDIANARIQVFDKTGRYFAQNSRFGLDAGELFRPAGAAMERETDTLFVSDGYFGTVSVFRKGEFRGLLLGQDGKPLTLDSPTGLSFRDGKLYLAETGGSRIHRYRIEWRATDTVNSIGKRVEVSQKDCVVCHLSWVNGVPESVKGPDKKGALPDVSFAMCYSCHNGAIMDSRIEIHRGDQHASIYDSDKLKAERKKAGDRKDKLPEEFPRTPTKDLSCGTCHTPHTDKAGQDKLYEGHRNAWLRVPNKGGDLCERCHESKAKDARRPKREDRGHNHPLAVRLEPAPAKDVPGYTRIDKLTEGLPDRVGEAGGALGHKNELICQSCHQVHGGHGERSLLTLDRSRAELCSQCHAQQYSKSKEDARHKGVHPVNVKPDESMKLQGKPVETVGCGTCHRVHNGNVGTALLPEGIRSPEELCKSCHERQHAEGKDAARKKGVHPVNNKLDDPVEIAAKKIEKVGCLSCHSVHHGKPDTAALVETDQDGRLCSHCHDNKQTVVGTDHDLRITAKDKPNRHGQLPRQVGVCGSCHTLHRGKGDQIRLFAGKVVKGWELPANDKMDDTDFKRDRLCLNCHQPGGLADKKVVKHFSHPHQDLVLRSDKNQMPLLNAEEKADEFGAIGCVTCHEPHLWRHGDKSKEKGKTIAVSSNKENVEGRNIDSFLRHKGVSGTFCVDCHGMEGLVKYKYFHDKARSRNKGVDYLK